jgi:ribonuclease HII
VVGAVVFPVGGKVPEGIADSKLLKPKQREDLSKRIQESALFYAIAEISVGEINRVGIGKATQMAFLKAVQSLKTAPDFLIIDAFLVEGVDRGMQKAIAGGDKLSVSIAAASIIAKVYRDALMVKLHEEFPEYGFAAHKGYGTKVHQEAIKKHGLCQLHRTSFNLNKFL